MNKDNKKWAINNIKYFARYFKLLIAASPLFLIHLFFLIQFYMIRPIMPIYKNFA